MFTKIQLRNLNQTSAKYWPNISFKSQPLKLQQTVANTILIINISNRININKFWDGIFTRQGNIKKVY